MKKLLKAYALIVPLLAGCLVFTVLPFLSVVQSSFRYGSGGSAAFVGLENFKKLLQNDMFRLAFGNSMRFLAVGVPLCLALSYTLAIFLKDLAGRYRLLKAVFLFPYIMPVAGTVLLIDLLFSDHGVANRLLFFLGLPVADWLGSPYAFAVMIALYLWKSTGYGVLLLLSGLITIPREQYEAAQMEGATAWHQFRYVTTPQMWNSLFVALVFAVVNAFKCFKEMFLVGGEHPNEHVYMLQHYLNNCFANLNYQRLSTASVLLFAVLFGSFLLLYAWVTYQEEKKL